MEHLTASPAKSIPSTGRRGILPIMVLSCMVLTIMDHVENKSSSKASGMVTGPYWVSAYVLACFAYISGTAAVLIKLYRAGKLFGHRTGFITCCTQLPIIAGNCALFQTWQSQLYIMSLWSWIAGSMYLLQQLGKERG